jgi:DNA-binding transcriptional ArsR family regulator
MRHSEPNKGQHSVNHNVSLHSKNANNGDFVLEKSIFNNIFEKDIRRVFIYKKAERLAKALHLIAPAFSESASLRNRIDAIAIGLVDAAVLAPSIARTALSRELLALSSVLSIARTGGLLSAMNAELIAHEAHILLQEVAAYEEPRLFLDEAPTLSGIAKSALKKESSDRTLPVSQISTTVSRTESHSVAIVRKGHIKDTMPKVQNAIKDRRDAVMSVIQNKGSVSIKDISTHIRGVSEKTIQRELLALIEAGIVRKQGERRWSTYSLVS